MSNNQPLVSVIAMCYNQSEYLEETLDSIAAQTYPNIELIITDDVSKDDSVEKIKNWLKKNNKQATLILHTENKGLCTTLNEGVAAAKGQYFNYIACDDIMMPEKLEQQVAILESGDDETALVYSDAYLIQGDGSPRYGWFIQQHRNFVELPQGNLFDILVQGNFIPISATLMKTNIIRKEGLFDENLSFEDYDMWLRLSRKYKFLLSDYVSLKYRLHPTNMHKNMTWARDKFLIYFKHKDLEHVGIRVQYHKELRRLYAENPKRAKQLLKEIKGKEKYLSSLLKISIRWGIRYSIYKILWKISQKLGGR